MNNLPTLEEILKITHIACKTFIAKDGTSKVITKGYPDEVLESIDPTMLTAKVTYIHSMQDGNLFMTIKEN